MSIKSARFDHVIWAERNLQHSQLPIERSVGRDLPMKLVDLFVLPRGFTEERTHSVQFAEDAANVLSIFNIANRFLVSRQKGKHLSAPIFRKTKVPIRTACPRDRPDDLADILRHRYAKKGTS